MFLLPWDLLIYSHHIANKSFPFKIALPWAVYKEKYPNRIIFFDEKEDKYVPLIDIRNHEVVISIGHISTKKLIEHNIKYFSKPLQNIIGNIYSNKLDPALRTISFIPALTDGRYIIREYEYLTRHEKDFDYFAEEVTENRTKTSERKKILKSKLALRNFKPITVVIPSNILDSFPKVGRKEAIDINSGEKFTYIEYPIYDAEYIRQEFSISKEELNKFLKETQAKDAKINTEEGILGDTHWLKIIISINISKKEIQTIKELFHECGYKRVTSGSSLHLQNIVKQKETINDEQVTIMYSKETSFGTITLWHFSETPYITIDQDLFVYNHELKPKNIDFKLTEEIIKRLI